MALVELEPLLPDAIFDLRYASENNVFEKAFYDDGFSPRLDESAAKALIKAANLFARHDLVIVVWDVWRPEDVQGEIAKLVNDPDYALDPSLSNHPKGLAFDGTLAQRDKTLLDMGTEYDDFSASAHSNAVEGLTPLQLRNRRLFATIMRQAGFVQWPTEWYHFDYVGDDNAERTA